MEVSQDSIKQFQETVWAFYRENARHSLPWRKTKDPYKVLVSELMLQQTQVSRVLVKYEEFLKYFPTIQKLAAAQLAEVLKAWQGLGYNRRAKFLHQLAKEVVQSYKGKLPSSEAELLALPGIGKATAAAVLAFAFNRPVVYLETNVRSVFLFYFFKDEAKPSLSRGETSPPKGETNTVKRSQSLISDAELLPLIERAAEGQKAREWNWALLDYGSYIKITYGNPNARSKHYAKQSKFKGSDREVRGAVLRILQEGPMHKPTLFKRLEFDPARIEKVMSGLLAEGLISKKGNLLHLGS